MEYQETALEVTALTAEQLLSGDRGEIARRMRLVIELEGPILDDLLEKRVLHSYGLVKRGSRIAPLLSEVRASLGAVTTTQRSCDGNEHTVYWQESWKGRDIEGTYTSFRAPSPRDISEYPVIEVANVMAQVGLQQSRKALWLETLRLLGFTKQGTQIRATFKLAYAWAKAHRA